MTAQSHVAAPHRPRRLVTVIGTGTEVGKTWVSVRLLADLRHAGLHVAARKPAQSFEPSDDPAGLDAAKLGAATVEPPDVVCPPHRWYEVAMAPSIAAEALGRPPFTTEDLVREVSGSWPEGCDVGLVETAGGLRSPLASDGDCLALTRQLHPDVTVLVADAGLGTLNAVRLTVDAIQGEPEAAPDGAASATLVVVLNRFDPLDDVHVRNRAWLSERDGLDVVTLPGHEAELRCRVMAI